MPSKRYVSAVLGMLLAGVILFPGRAMAPPPAIERELGEQRRREVEPRPKFPLVQISGTVTVPDGRKLNGVQIRLYELRAGRPFFVKENKTNRAGFYSLGLGGSWLERQVRVIPQYPGRREGDGFIPQEYDFPISTANNPSHDFRYEGPLPDLRPIAGSGYSGFRLRGGVCIYYFTVKNLFGTEACPCKVRVRYVDKGPDLSGTLESYKTHSIPALAAGASTTVEVELGPGSAADEGAGSGLMGSLSGSGRYKVKSIRVDIDDEVAESNEDNNHLGF